MGRDLSVNGSAVIIIVVLTIEAPPFYVKIFDHNYHWRISFMLVVKQKLTSTDHEWIYW